MNIFLDTSSLFKLYHKEPGTKELMDFFNKNTIEVIYLAELTEIEFSSVIWKECRKKEIDEKVALILIEAFEKDSKNFNFVSLRFFRPFVLVQLIVPFIQKIALAKSIVS